MLISCRLFSILRHLPAVRRYPEVHGATRICSAPCPARFTTQPVRNAPHAPRLPSRTPLDGPSSSSHIPSFSGVPFHRHLSTSVSLSVCNTMRIRHRGDDDMDETGETTPGGLPVIRFPTRLSGKLRKAVERKQMVDEMRREDRRRLHERPLIVACKDPMFNHRLGAPLKLPKGRKGYKIRSPKHNPRFLTLLLASQAWKKPKSKGDWFQIRRYTPMGGHPSLSDSYQHEQPGFDKFPLHPNLQAAVRDLQFEASTAIQNEAIPSLLSGESAILSAETGSGKTLAYLLPTLHRLMTEQNPQDAAYVANAPRALVLVPSRELVDQVFEMVKEVLKYDEVLQVEKRVGGGQTYRKVKNPKPGKVDLLIATPGILSALLAKGVYTLSRVQTAILDECDTLLDDSFNHVTRDFLARIPLLEGPITFQPQADGSPDPTTLQQTLPSQLILVGATTPKSLQPILDGVFNSETLVKIKTGQAHRIQPHVLQTFLRLGKDDKPAKVLELVREDAQHGLVTMVFCGETKTAVWLVRFMQENGLKAELLAKCIQAGNRAQTYRNFKEGGVNIVVGTDMASRGLDTTFVDHVINYDFPRVVSDYIHRGGRVGRLGTGQGRSRGSGSGRITSLVAAKWEVPTVQAVEEAVRRSTEIHNVNANIARVMNARMGLEPLPDITGQGKHGKGNGLDEEETEGVDKLY